MQSGVTNLMLLVFSVIANIALSGALGTAHGERDQARAALNHIIDQRVSVLEVEQFIQSKRPRLNAALRRGYAEQIVDAAAEFKQPPMLLANVAKAESWFDATAVGDDGKSIGLFQVQRFWVKEIPFLKHSHDLYRPDLNIRAGAYILNHYAKTCGEELVVMLACYNGGYRRPKKARDYAERVSAGFLGT